MPKGIYLGNKGKKLTEEHKRKIALKSIFQKGNKLRVGQIPWNKGKKGLQVAWNKGKHHSKETIRKMSIRLKGKPAWNKGKPFLKLEKNPSWRGGISFEPYSTDWTETLKRAIRERDNYICQLCGKTQIEELEKIEQKLTVHHIDYDKQNSNLNNLITLCASCNGKVNRDRDYWTEFFKNKLKCILI